MPKPLALKKKKKKKKNAELFALHSPCLFQGQIQIQIEKGEVGTGSGGAHVSPFSHTHQPSIYNDLIYVHITISYHYTYVSLKAFFLNHFYKKYIYISTYMVGKSIHTYIHTFNYIYIYMYHRKLWV